MPFADGSRSADGYGRPADGYGPSGDRDPPQGNPLTNRDLRESGDGADGADGVFPSRSGDDEEFF